MKNKIVCLLLIFSLLFSNNLTMALEKESLTAPPSITLAQKTPKPSPSMKKSCYIKKGTYAVIASFTSVLFFVGGCLSGYFIGYKNGQRFKLNASKNINLKGSASFEEYEVLREIGEPMPISIAQKYIKDILRNEIPKLYQDDKFELSKLAQLEYYLKNSCKFVKNEELSRELKTLSRRIQSFFHKSEITLGTLTDLINDAQEIVDRVYEDVYKQK